MKNHEIPSAEERLPITSPDAMEQAIRDIEQQEQLYSIALFDILGFSNLVQNNGTQIVLDLYNKLLDIIHKMESNYSGNGTLAGSVVPVPVSQDWKNNQLIADANGYIHVCHFSDTFLIYTHYLFKSHHGGSGVLFTDWRKEHRVLFAIFPRAPHLSVFSASVHGVLLRGS